MGHNNRFKTRKDLQNNQKLLILNVPIAEKAVDILSDLKRCLILDEKKVSLLKLCKICAFWRIFDEFNTKTNVYSQNVQNCLFF